MRSFAAGARALTGACALGLLTMATGTLAADLPIPGKLIVAKETKVLKGIFKPTAGTFALPALGSPADPLTGAPVTIAVFDTSGASETFGEALIVGTGFPEGWKGLGNPAGSKGFKYKNKNGGKDAGEPCKIVLIKEKIIKFVCKGDDVNFPSAVLGGTAGVIIDFDSGGGGDRYCAELGGDEKKNQQLGNGLHLLKRKDAVAPGACPVPPLPTTTSTSTSSTSSTSTSSTSTSSTSSTSTTSTSSTSTTSTSLPPPCTTCCDGSTVVGISFATVDAPGDCGDLSFFNGTPYGDVACSGLYFGGGGNSVPLPASLPDLGNAVTKITSCSGSASVLAGTTSVETGSNLNCSAPGCLFGAPLAIPNTGSTPTSTCVLNTVQTAATGTVDCSTGATSVNLPLLSEVFLTGDDEAAAGIQPCPRCVAGTCTSGPNVGVACTAGTTAINSAYPTSHDCPPPPGDSLGSIPISFALSTGTVTWTAAPSGGQARVFAGFCRDADITGNFEFPGQPCFTNGSATFSCSQPFESCQQRNQGAFGPGGQGVGTISAIGTPTAGICSGPAGGTLVSVFGIPPVDNGGAVDAAGDLPGPGATAIPGTATTCTSLASCP